MDLGAKLITKNEVQHVDLQVERMDMCHYLSIVVGDTTPGIIVEKH